MKFNFAFCAFICFLFVKTNAYSQNDYQVAFSGHYVSFGSGDFLGYGTSFSIQKELVKKPRLGLAGLKVGGEFIVDRGNRGMQSVYKDFTVSDYVFIDETMSNIWIKASYYPFHKYIPGFNVSVGPTFGYKSEIYGKKFQFTPITGTDLYRKEILEFAREKVFNYGYRISFGYDFLFKDQKLLLGLRTDFYNNNLGNINSNLGIKLGYNFAK